MEKKHVPNHQPVCDQEMFSPVPPSKWSADFDLPDQHMIYNQLKLLVGSHWATDSLANEAREQILTSPNALIVGGIDDHLTAWPRGVVPIQESPGREATKLPGGQWLQALKNGAHYLGGGFSQHG